MWEEAPVTHDFMHTGRTLTVPRCLSDSTQWLDLNYEEHKKISSVEVFFGNKENVCIVECTCNNICSNRGNVNIVSFLDLKRLLAIFNFGKYFLVGHGGMKKESSKVFIADIRVERKLRFNIILHNSNYEDENSLNPNLNDYKEDLKEKNLTLLEVSARIKKKTIITTDIAIFIGDNSYNPSYTYNCHNRNIMSSDSNRDVSTIKVQYLP
ncbi:Hypothetical predicted protein [Octopus vulgaris]|uniref:Uncharacterized protein n=1 Tax=Octopus vulgaris TaxID=6645 RepID=A0AA36F229_OCTVU|nr:Hypothetical predicted protein [Octopus vulgaris]